MVRSSAAFDLHVRKIRYRLNAEVVRVPHGTGLVHDGLQLKSYLAARQGKPVAAYVGHGVQGVVDIVRYPA